MNLLCFPHYTCGGLLCDIFQNTLSATGKNGEINSLNHTIGKIGDSDTVFDNYNIDQFLYRIKEIGINNNVWIGTHCWPGILPDISCFDKVLIITTTTSRSKIYRWTRAYYHYYEKSVPWQSTHGMDRIDKERETAKNYLKPFLPVFGANTVNIEFSEIVEQTPQFLNLVKNFNIAPHITRWKSINKFLYDQDIWNSIPVKRFYESELEINLNQQYVYE